MPNYWGNIQVVKKPKCRNLFSRKDMADYQRNNFTNKSSIRNRDRIHHGKINH